MGRGGGYMVSMIAFYSNDPSSNPVGVFSFYSLKLLEKNKNKQKRGWEWVQFKKSNNSETRFEENRNER